MRDNDYSSLIGVDGLGQCVDGFNVEVVRGLILLGKKIIKTDSQKATQTFNKRKIHMTWLFKVILYVLNITKFMVLTSLNSHKMQQQTLCGRRSVASNAIFFFFLQNKLFI